MSLQQTKEECGEQKGRNLSPTTLIKQNVEENAEEVRKGIGKE